MDKAIAEIDLHGKSQRQAERIIDDALRLAGAGTYQIRLIHGFHGGTALRDMIRARYQTHEKVKRIITQDFGITILVLKELY